MAIVQILGIADLPWSSGTSKLVAQPTTPLRSITGYLPSEYSASRPDVLTTNKLDPCARIANLQATGARLAPEQAKQLTDACRESKGIAPEQPARYQPSTGDVTDDEGALIDPTTGMPETPWYKRPSTWLIGGAVLVGGYLLFK